MNMKLLMIFNFSKNKDKLTKEITLVRDFAGIKPLFYGYSRGQ